MRIKNKLLIPLFALLSISIFGCSDDDTNEYPVEQESTLQLEQENMKVKIGSENKATVNIKQGGGEYNAFSLNPEVAQTTIEDGVIKVEGLNNGKTEIIISDKDGHYRKIPVSVYTIDNLTLKNESIEFVTRLGCSKTIESNVLEGNGGYSIVSSNKAITASITKEGIITLTGASKPEKITAIVTVTDCSGFTTEMTVHLIGTNVAYTNEELESIKATSTSRYYLNEYNTKKVQVTNQLRVSTRMVVECMVGNMVHIISDFISMVELK